MPDTGVPRPASPRRCVILGLVGGPDAEAARQMVDEGADGIAVVDPEAAGALRDRVSVPVLVWSEGSVQIPGEPARQAWGPDTDLSPAGRLGAFAAVALEVDDGEPPPVLVTTDPGAARRVAHVAGLVLAAREER